MKHALWEQATPEEQQIAHHVADWLIDAIATSTQDRQFLRGDPEADDVYISSIMANARIAAIRAMRGIK